MQDGKEQWFKPTAVSFESRKDVVQLLSADMLAWTCAKIRAAQLFGRGFTEEASIAADIIVGSKNLKIGFVSKETVHGWERGKLKSKSHEEKIDNGVQPAAE